MNIEEILPELFTSSPSSPPNEKRVYYCQRCLNHGLRYKRKNHKTDCAFRFCTCNDCEMISRRRELNSLLRQEYSPDPVLSSSTTSHPSPTDSISTALTSESESLLLFPCLVASSSDEALGSKERRPNCQRCAQHNTSNRLKGHKRICPFKECSCPKCQVVLERQKLMADQIKLRRKQKKEKLLMADPSACSPSPMEESSPSTVVEHSICGKCTSQALSYQQLMGVLDPSLVVDPIATLALLLPVCPHREDSN